MASQYNLTYAHRITVDGPQKMSWWYEAQHVALLQKAAALGSNSNTTAPALGSTINTMSRGNISTYTANWVRQVILQRRRRRESETYRNLADYLGQIKAKSVQVVIRLLEFSMIQT